MIINKQQSFRYDIPNYVIGIKSIYWDDKVKRRRCLKYIYGFRFCFLLEINYYYYAINDLNNRYIKKMCHTCTFCYINVTYWDTFKSKDNLYIQYFFHRQEAYY